MSIVTPKRRWDPVVKLTHWSIALAVLANAVVTAEGSGAHVWVGYALAAILSLRLLWGLIGPSEARFSAFWPSPRKAIAHLREIKVGRTTAHTSHNPLGALMVYAIWSCLLVIIGTGIAMAGLPGVAVRTNAAGGIVAVDRVALPSFTASEAGEEGEESGEGGESDEGPFAEVHEIAANLLYILILLHIAGVVFETRRSGRQVALAMVPFAR